MRPMIVRIARVIAAALLLLALAGNSARAYDGGAPPTTESQPVDPGYEGNPGP